MTDSLNLQWHTVRGIDSDGLSIKRRLDELVDGALSYEEQIEVLVDLCRDGVASTAGYAAIPILLTNNCGDLRTKWEMIRTAVMIVSSSTRAESPLVPFELSANLDLSVRSKIRSAVLKTAADADLSAAELLDSLSIAVSMLGRQELAEVLERLALREYGVEL